MNRFLEKVMYSFGINYSGYDVATELLYLSQHLPSEYTHRDITDIGCGDGKISKRIASVLESESYCGVDRSKQLIKSALRRGIRAKVLDIEKEELVGDVGILWGVVHHLNEPTKALSKLTKNFNGLIIRESIDEKRFFELGHKFDRAKLMSVLADAGVTIVKTVEIPQNKSIIIFAKRSR